MRLYDTFKADFHVVDTNVAKIANFVWDEGNAIAEGLGLTILPSGNTFILTSGHIFNLRSF